MLKKIVLIAALVTVSLSATAAKNDWQETVTELLYNEQFTETLYQFSGSANYEAFQHSVGNFKDFRRADIAEDYSEHDAFSTYIMFRYFRNKQKYKKALAALNKLYIHTHDSKTLVFEKMLGVVHEMEDPNLYMAYFKYYDSVHGIENNLFVKAKYEEFFSSAVLKQSKVEKKLEVLSDEIESLRSEITPEGVTFIQEVLQERYREAKYSVRVEVNAG